MNHSLPKTTFVTDAFYKTMLGREVEMTIDQLGTDLYTVLQHDMYHIIVETVDGEHLLVAKSAIVAVVSPDTALPELQKAIADGVTAIQYKATQKRLDTNKNKGPRKFTPRPRYDEKQEPVERNVPITVKPKRTFQP